jgi:hypothetical protein
MRRAVTTMIFHVVLCYNWCKNLEWLYRNVACRYNRCSATTVVARHIKSIFIFVYVVFKFSSVFFYRACVLVTRVSAAKHMIIGATSRYNDMLFHVARRYNVIL